MLTKSWFGQHKLKVKEKLWTVFFHAEMNSNPVFSVLESDGFHVFLGLASISVVFTLIGLAHMIWKNCDFKCKCCALCKDLEKQDVNDIYGTHARGWDGEGGRILDLFWPHFFLSRRPLIVLGPTYTRGDRAEGPGLPSSLEMECGNWHIYAIFRRLLDCNLLWKAQNRFCPPLSALS